MYPTRVWMCVMVAAVGMLQILSVDAQVSNYTFENDDYYVFKGNPGFIDPANPARRCGANLCFTGLEPTHALFSISPSGQIERLDIPAAVLSATYVQLPNDLLLHVPAVDGPFYYTDGTVAGTWASPSMSVFHVHFTTSGVFLLSSLPDVFGFYGASLFDTTTRNITQLSGAVPDYGRYYPCGSQLYFSSNQYGDSYIYAINTSGIFNQTSHGLRVPAFFSENGGCVADRYLVFAWNTFTVGVLDSVTNNLTVVNITSPLVRGPVVELGTGPLVVNGHFLYRFIDQISGLVQVDPVALTWDIMESNTSAVFRASPSSTHVYYTIDNDLFAAPVPFVADSEVLVLSDIDIANIPLVRSSHFDFVALVSESYGVGVWIVKAGVPQQVFNTSYCFLRNFWLSDFPGSTPFSLLATWSPDTGSQFRVVPHSGAGSSFLVDPFPGPEITLDGDLLLETDSRFYLDIYDSRYGRRAWWFHKADPTTLHGPLFDANGDHCGDRAWIGGLSEVGGGKILFAARDNVGMNPNYLLTFQDSNPEQVQLHTEAGSVFSIAENLCSLPTFIKCEGNLVCITNLAQTSNFSAPASPDLKQLCLNSTTSILYDGERLFIAHTGNANVSAEIPMPSGITTQFTLTGTASYNYFFLRGPTVLVLYNLAAQTWIDVLDGSMVSQVQQILSFNGTHSWVNWEVDYGNGSVLWARGFLRHSDAHFSLLFDLERYTSFQLAGQVGSFISAGRPDLLFVTDASIGTTYQFATERYSDQYTTWAGLLSWGPMEAPNYGLLSFSALPPIHNITGELPMLFFPGSYKSRLAIAKTGYADLAFSLGLCLRDSDCASVQTYVPSCQPYCNQTSSFCRCYYPPPPPLAPPKESPMAPPTSAPTAGPTAGPEAASPTAASDATLTFASILSVFFACLAILLV